MSRPFCLGRALDLCLDRNLCWRCCHRSAYYQCISTVFMSIGLETFTYILPVPSSSIPSISSSVMRIILGEVSRSAILSSLLLLLQLFHQGVKRPHFRARTGLGTLWRWRFSWWSRSFTIRIAWRDILRPCLISTIPFIGWTVWVDDLSSNKRLVLVLNSKRFPWPQITANNSIFINEISTKPNGVLDLDDWKRRSPQSPRKLPLFLHQPCVFVALPPPFAFEMVSTSSWSEKTCWHLSTSSPSSTRFSTIKVRSL